MRCIFCLEEKSSSVEHVFPEAIGSTLVIDRVCKDCNSDLGAGPDARISNHPVVMLARSHLGVAGKRGEVPDPFKDVFRIGSLVDDPTQRVRASMAKREGESLEIEILYNKTVKTLEDGREAIQIAIDTRNADQIATIIQRERRRAGLPSLAAEELRAAIQGTTQTTIEHPWVRYKLPVDVIEYQRGVAKIAYELAWYWLGDRYLDDPIAVALRQAVTSSELISELGTRLGIRGSITLGADALPLRPWKHNPNVHIGLAMRTGDHVTVAVRIFSCMCGLIRVSDNASNYTEFAPANHDGRFIEIDPRSGLVRECLLADEILRLTGGSPATPSVI